MSGAGLPTHVGVCSDCGKRSFLSRQAAKRAARLIFPGDGMRAYACGGMWHIGHLDERIVHGEKPR